jgi:anti-anti-sigma regulatory factor
MVQDIRKTQSMTVQAHGDLRNDVALRRFCDAVRHGMRGNTRRDDEGELRIDLSGLTQMNSALLAALIALGVEATRSGAKLVVAGPPEFFRAYSEVLGVDQALGRVLRFETT